MELSVDVAAYCDWRIDLYDIAFFDEELASLVGQFTNLGFWYRSTGAQLGDGAIGEESLVASQQKPG